MLLLYYLYFFFIALPLFLLATILTALTAGLGSALFGAKFFAYYPGMLWSKISLALFLCPVRIRGKENIPRHIAPIVISNHESALDIFLLYGYMGIPFKWVLKSGIRKIPFVGWACKKCGFIFVDQSSIQTAARTVDLAKQAAAEGYSIFIFPEGSRSTDGQLKRFKKGAFKIALDTRATILPVYIEGTHEALPKARYIPRPHQLSLSIGETFRATDFCKAPKPLASLTQEGYERVLALQRECM